MFAELSLADGYRALQQVGSVLSNNKGSIGEAYVMGRQKDFIRQIVGREGTGFAIFKMKLHITDAMKGSGVTFHNEKSIDPDITILVDYGNRSGLRVWVLDIKTGYTSGNISPKQLVNYLNFIRLSMEESAVVRKELSRKLIDDPQARDWMRQQKIDTRHFESLFEEGISRLDYLFLPGGMPTGEKVTLPFFENGREVTRTVDESDPLVAAVRVAEVIKTGTPSGLRTPSILDKIKLNYLTEEGIKKIDKRNYAPE